MNTKIFWIFGALQAASLGAIILVLFKALGTINGSAVIGSDTHLLRSVSFPLCHLIVQYIIYRK
ncbi:MAG: hypothetical protein KAY24_17765 [Candidatus Eisenbacteria sp.]|nr:hypothetical protein [Candidatus Eisenbacteria bacterium]